MKKLWIILIATAGCQNAGDHGSGVWYDRAELVCHQKECGACQGRSAVRCGPCGGDGGLVCMSCKDGTQKCSTCGGDGQYKGKPCKGCGANGRVACWTCGGDCRIECAPCGGKGSILCLRLIRITEPLPTGADVWPPTPTH